MINNINAPSFIPNWNNSNIIYVSKSSNATDNRNFIQKYSQEVPFATIRAAINAASSGDLIKVLPGIYLESVTGKNGVNINCDGTISGSSAPALSLPDGVSCNVWGNGKYYSSASDSQAVLLEGAGKVVLKADHIEQTYTGALVSAALLTQFGKESYIDVNTIISNSYDAMISFQAGRTFVNASLISGKDSGLEISDTDFYGNIKNIYSEQSNGVLFSNYGGQTASLYCNYIRGLSPAVYCASSLSSKITLIGAVISHFGGSDSLYVEEGLLNLVGCNILSGVINGADDVSYISLNSTYYNNEFPQGDFPTVTGATYLSQLTSSTPPNDGVNPVGWLPVFIDGNYYQLALYQ